MVNFNHISVRRAINNQKSGMVYLQFIADFNSSSEGTDRVDLKSGGITQDSFVVIKIKMNSNLYSNNNNN